MFTRNLYCIPFLLMLAVTAAHAVTDQPAFAGDERAQAAIGAADSSPSPYSLVDLPEEILARLTPLQLALRAVLLTEQAELAPLYEAFARETDSLRGLEIQKQIQTVKQNTELSLLRTQAEFARQEGRIAVAERLEASLREMTEPTPPEPQAPRPQR